MNIALIVWVTIIIAFIFNSYLYPKSNENEELLSNLEKYEQKERKK